MKNDKYTSYSDKRKILLISSSSSFKWLEQGSSNIRKNSDVISQKISKNYIKILDEVHFFQREGKIH